MKYAGIVLQVIIGAFAAYLLLCIVSALFVNTKKEYCTNSRYYRFLLNSSTAIGLCILRVKIHVTGREMVPADRRFVLVSNHRSNYDPIVTWRAFAKYDLAFISKASNFNVPMWGRLIRRCGFLSIDRSSPRSSVETINKAAGMINDGIVSIGVYPEGTRSKDCRLLPFHNGVFLIAEKTKAPVVVMALRGTEQIHKRCVFRRTHVYLDVLDVITPEELEGKMTHEIGERVRRDLEDFLEV